MSQDNQPNLAGWAAIITAIATLITAIGFPNFFPDLVKKYLPQDKDNSSTNSSKTQKDNGSLPSTSKPSASSPPPPISSTRLSDEILYRKCQEGAAPDTVLFPTKEKYLEGEYITVEFANACPNKTLLVVKTENSPTSGMNTGQKKRSILAREYTGKLTFDKSSLRAGSYEIQAYFRPDGRNLFFSGASKIFKVVSRS